MLKYTTFHQLLIGEALDDGAWLHILPGRERYALHQQMWVQGGAAAIETYNRYQTQRNFTAARRIFVLLPLAAAEHYVFIGAYDVSTDDRPQQVLPAALSEQLWVLPEDIGKAHFLVDNHHNPAVLSECIGRLVLRWDKPVRNRSLRAITAGPQLQLVALRQQPFGPSDIPFPGFHSFHWSFAELAAQLSSPLLAWRSALASVAGVYAVTDIEHGLTYIGAAYGETGIWGRWMGYAATQHNDNVLLKDHILAHGTQHLRFSVLLTMDLSSTRDQVLAKESFFKLALGTRALGLNEN